MAATARSLRPVRIWLLLVALLVAAMVLAPAAIVVCMTVDFASRGKYDH